MLSVIRLQPWGLDECTSRNVRLHDFEPADIASFVFFVFFVVQS